MGPLVQESEGIGAWVREVCDLSEGPVRRMFREEMSRCTMALLKQASFSLVFRDKALVQHHAVMHAEL